MNIYDKRYHIRLAEPADIPNIMKFIHTHWKANHILSIDRNFFEYEFLEDDTVNFILAIDKNTNTLEAFAGFLPCSHTNNKEQLDVWGSFWKVNDMHKNIAFLGVELIKRLHSSLQYRSHIGVGINPNTSLPLRKMVFQEHTGKMNHYYLLNPNINDYKIPIINNFVYTEPNKNIPLTYAKLFHSVDEIKVFFDIETLDTIPYKDFWYVNKRFFRHPYYTYSVYGLSNSVSNDKALLIGREICQFDRKIFRIVDYIGEAKLISGCGFFLQNLIEEQCYEYIDFYNYGFDDLYMRNAGFTLKDNNDTNIIPNYFEPFLQENVDIWVRSTYEGTIFCKADGDQDRPNIARG